MFNSLHRFALLVVMIIVTSRCQAQNPEPQVMIDGGASTGPVTALAFSPDSSLLYVAGLDKTVQVWNLSDVDETSFEASRVQQLYWETRRHRRGEIAALTVSKTDGTIAFAGQGVRNSNGDIVLVNPANAQFQQVLPKFRPTGRENRNGHMHTVLHLDFSPSGKHLVSISEDREVRVWNIATNTSVVIRAGLQTGKFPRFLSAIFVNEQQIAFLDQIVNAAGNPQNVVMLARADGTTPPAIISNSHRDRSEWNCLTTSENDSTLLACAAGELQSWKLSTLSITQNTLKQSPEESISALHESHGNLFLSGASSKKLTNTFKPFARIVNQQTGATHELDLKWDFAADHCVSKISPDGRWFVVANNFSSEIKVWRINPGQLAPRAGPLSLKSRILAPHSIQFADADKEPYLLRIQFNDARAQEDVAIDVASGGFYPKYPDRNWRDSSLDPNFKVVRNDGFTLPGIQNAKALVVQQNGQPRCKITLTPNQSTAVSSCWLKDTHNKIWGVAIGTNYPDCGVYAYRLADNQQECELVRYFRDHRSDVVSLTQSANANVLASASLDGTTKFWSLNKLYDSANGSFNKSVGWGMELEAQAQGVLVKNVTPYSIAASNKISQGDMIEFVVTPAPGGGGKKETSGTQILEWLNQSALTTPQILKVNSQNSEFYVTPGWDPMVSLMIDQRKEWVAVASDGRFQSSLLEGDRLINWLISHGRDMAPSILPGASLREQLHDDFLLDDMFSNLDVAPAVVPDMQLLSQQPIFKIMSPALNVVYPGGQAIQIRAEFSGDIAQPKNIDWQAYASNTPLGPPDETGNNFAVWNYRPSAPLEDIFIRATHNNNTFTASQFLRSNTQPAVGYRLHLISAGVDPTGELAFVDRDAEEIDHHFKNQRKRVFQMGYQKLLTNENATTENILQEMKLASQQIQSRSDLFVLFLSGHGTVFEDKYCFVSNDWKNGQPPEADLLILSSDKIEAAFDGINCRRALVLDTCFSSTSIAGLARAGKKLRDHGIMIFSAVSGDNAIAKQNDQLQHGMFTGAILSGLRGPADGYANVGNLNHQITMAELVKYVMDDVQRQSGYEQRPGFVPSSFIETNQSSQHNNAQELRVITEVQTSE